jgi:hypothetical protein
VGYEALPKRFKDYIAALERAVHAVRSVLDAEGETRVRLEYYGDREVARYLPEDARVVFYLAADVPGGLRRGQARVEVQMDRRRGSNGIAVSSPDGRVVVLPEVSNEVCVRVSGH